MLTDHQAFRTRAYDTQLLGSDALGPGAARLRHRLPVAVRRVRDVADDDRVPHVFAGLRARQPGPLHRIRPVCVSAHVRGSAQVPAVRAFRR